MRQNVFHLVLLFSFAYATSGANNDTVYLQTLRDIQRYYENLLIRLLDSERVLMRLEPFSCGSHKQLIDLLYAEFPDSQMFSLPGKKWHWKARTAALYLSQAVPQKHSYRVLFSSSVLNLAELVALRPDLGQLWKVLYFHENQLVYPVRKQQDRDFQYGYNQIISCLVADRVVFNSKYNMESFLSSVNTFLKLIPDHRPKGIPERIRPKCCVLNFPIVYPNLRNLNAFSEEIPRKKSEQGRQFVDECIRNKCDKVDENLLSSTYSEDIDKTEIGIETPDLSCPDISNLHQRNQANFQCKIAVLEDEDDNVVKVHVINEIDKKLSPILSNFESSTSEGCTASVSDSNTSGNKANMEQDCMCETLRSAVCDDATNEEKAFEHPVRPGVEKKPLHIVWPHRWEHDKGPESFFQVLFRLHEADLNFHLSVLGEHFTDVPEIFHEAKQHLSSKVLHWGYQDSKEDFYNILQQADCVVSTAQHEFFGVAMLEAVYCGCYPLCPNRLVYPEIFPAEYLYNTDNQLFKRLRELCRKPHLCRNHKAKIDLQKYSWAKLKMDYTELLKPPSR